MPEWKPDNPGDHQIGILGEAAELEVHLRQQGAALEEKALAEELTERPEEAGQVVVLLHSGRLNPLLRRGFPAAVRRWVSRRNHVVSPLPGQKATRGGAQGDGVVSNDRLTVA